MKRQNGYFDPLALASGLAIAIAVVLVGWICWLAYEAATSPTFSLRKDSWLCTREHVELRPMLIGKVTVMQPYDVCDQWSRR